MRDVWTSDDLLFAVVRSLHMEHPGQVAGNLLAAADRPVAHLREVSAFQAHLRAAEVLIRAGKRDDGVAILRPAVAKADPSADAAALITAAGVLLDATGDPDEAEMVSLRAVRAPRHGRFTGFGALMTLSLALAASGHLDHALRVADALTVPASERRRPGAAELSTHVDRLAQLTKAEITALRDAGPHSHVGAPGHILAKRDGDLTDGDGLNFPAWPAVSAPFLLWWPEVEYARIIRQVPELKAVLGATWQAHAAAVEAALRATQFHSPPTPAPGNAAQLALRAADYSEYVRYLERTGRDPRSSATLTAYSHDRSGGPQTSWPPQPRQPCWCESGKKYQRCCGA